MTPRQYVSRVRSRSVNPYVFQLRAIGWALVAAVMFMAVCGRSMHTMFPEL